jgi:hypothetical protein
MSLAMSLFVSNRRGMTSRSACANRQCGKSPCARDRRAEGEQNRLQCDHIDSAIAARA